LKISISFTLNQVGLSLNNFDKFKSGGLRENERELQLQVDFVLRSKHIASRLSKPISQWCVGKCALYVPKNHRKPSFISAKFLNYSDTSANE